MKFITLTNFYTEENIAVNSSNITKILTRKLGSQIHFVGGNFVDVKETLEEIHKLINGNE